jgi:hypothetical protein
MSCASSCKTPGTHNSYGECLRSKGIAVTGLESTSPSFTREAEKTFNSDVDAYSAARAQGIQPATTARRDIDAAVEASQRLQVPFDAASPPTVASDA